eukprot:5956253-Amphidinium_carterae.1
MALTPAAIKAKTSASNFTQGDILALRLSAQQSCLATNPDTGLPVRAGERTRTKSDPMRPARG